ncbi:unnamed protein product [Haemonchus placei]|uniref:Uncharacterized protein n=1 Tax=Haemonchus placei TaxID=6290 RepID=A0A3P7Y933_HAEPC|nr:unnamed protein product [Haemonchus placei]
MFYYRCLFLSKPQMDTLSLLTALADLLHFPKNGMPSPLAALFHRPKVSKKEKIHLLMIYRVVRCSLSGEVPSELDPVIWQMVVGRPVLSSRR